jgi:hypothetical protein
MSLGEFEFWTMAPLAPEAWRNGRARSSAARQGLI